MKFFKVTYSNYNFRTSILGVKSENNLDAIKLAKEYAGNERFEEAKATEITESEYLSFEEEFYKKEQIRF